MTRRPLVAIDALVRLHSQRKVALVLSGASTLATRRLKAAANRTGETRKHLHKPKQARHKADTAVVPTHGLQLGPSIGPEVD